MEDMGSQRERSRNIDIFGYLFKDTQRERERYWGLGFYIDIYIGG